MTDRTIRRFRPGDEARVRELDEAAMRETPEYVPGAPDDDLRAVTETYLDAGGEFLVAEHAGGVIATGAYRPVADGETDPFDDLAHPAAELTRIRVDPDHQRYGHGRAICEDLERRARADGYRELVLDTGAENHAARRLYEGLGFDLSQCSVVTFGDVQLDLAFYRKSIDA